MPTKLVNPPANKTCEPNATPCKNQRGEDNDTGFNQKKEDKLNMSILAVIESPSKPPATNNKEPAKTETDPIRERPRRLETSL